MDLSRELSLKTKRLTATVVCSVRLLCLLAISALASVSAFAVTVTNVTVLSPGVRTYEPITVRADFDAPFCMGTVTPKYSSLKLERDLLTVRLSHLKGETCVTSHTVELPGLPTGTYRLKVAITASRFVQPAVFAETYEASAVEIPLTVEQFFFEEFQRAFGCARTSDTGVRYMTSLSGCVRPLVGPSSVNDAPLEIDVAKRDGKGSFIFRIFRVSQGGGAAAITTGLPEAFTPLTWVEYPPTLNGGVFTTSLAECKGLAKAWGREDKCDLSAFRVLKLVNGACPLGSSRVYRLFHPVAVEHRYTQEEGILPLLVKAGYIVEGAVFCA